MATTELGLVNDRSDGDDLFSLDLNGDANKIDQAFIDRRIAYGELYQDAPAGQSLVVTTAGTYYGWTTAAAGLVSGAGKVTADTTQATGDQLIVGASGGGTYEVAARISFKGPASANITAAVHKNGAIQTNLKGYLEMDATPKVRCLVITGMLALVNADYLDLRFTSGTNGDSLTLYDVSLVIRRIGP